MSPAPVNGFKERLRAGDTQFGLWMSLASTVSAEALSHAGFDWLMFDTEHAPVDIVLLQQLLQAAAGGGTPCLARPAWNDRVMIKQMLDVGVQTLLVPFVQDAQEARAAVAATRYPPEGVRGVAGATRASRYGQARDYLRTAGDQICVIVQVETGEALANLEEIARVDGVDGVFIGPSDLSASLGHLGNPGAAEVQTVLRDAVARIEACGKAPGILATNAEDALRYRGWGYRFIAASLDIGLLLGGAQALRARLQAPG